MSSGAELGQHNFDKDFRDQFVIDNPNEAGTYYFNGHPFVCLANRKSHWHDVYEPSQNGFVYQEAELTIINPDVTAAIAFIDVSVHRQLKYAHNEFQLFSSHGSNSASTISVAYPRDPQTLAEPGSKKFADVLQSQIPSAAFVAGINGSHIPMVGTADYQRNFVKQELGITGGAWGLNVLSINIKGERHDRGNLEDFLNAPALTSTPSIREGFRQILESFFGRNRDLNLPMRNDQPLLENANAPLQLDDEAPPPLEFSGLEVNRLKINTKLGEYIDALIFPSPRQQFPRFRFQMSPGSLDP